jgi:hypothetical protein
MSDTGASISIKDPRVSRLIDFAQPVVSGLAVAGLIYFATQVGALRDAVVETNKQLALNAQQNTRMVEDLRDHEGRIRVLEGRNLRGFNDAPPLPSEVARGH